MRKKATLLATVTYDPKLTLAGARLEIRTLVNEACNYHAELGDVRIRGLKSWRPPNTDPLLTFLRALEAIGFGTDDDINGGDLVDLVNNHYPDFRKAVLQFYKPDTAVDVEPDAA